ncbi:hypothetical protein KUCAC02_004044, partial [Chaenocephalus aceratus]
NISIGLLAGNRLQSNALLTDYWPTASSTHFSPNPHHHNCRALAPFNQNGFHP